MKSLQTISIDSLLDAIGEKPEMIQLLIGERAIDRLEKTIRQEVKEEIKKKITSHLSNELIIIVPDIVKDLIHNQTVQSLDLPANARSVYNIYDTYRNVPTYIVDVAWNIAESCMNQIQSELIFTS
jgi:hypothetical protein